MRKIFTLLLLILLFPITTLAENQTVYVGGVELTGNTDSPAYATTDDSGNVTTAGATADNYNIMWDGSTLTLKDAYITKYVNDGSSAINGTAIGVANSSGNAELTIQLEGSNTVSASTDVHVYANSGTATLNITGENGGSLNASDYSNSGIWVQSNSSNATLTIQNADVTLTPDYGIGVTVQAGNSSNASLTVEGGSLTASGRKGILFPEGNPSLNVSGNTIVRASGGIATGTNENEPVTTDGTGIVFNGSTGTVYGNVTLKEDLTIGEGESLDIPSGASLTIPEGTTLTVNGGTLTQNGNVTGDITYKVTKVELDETSLTLKVGDEETLIPTITPDNATNQTVTWSSDNEQVATVENGKVTAVGAGTATITVKTEDGEFTATCEVTVNKATPTFDEWTVMGKTYDGNPITITPPTLNGSTITEGITLSYKGKEEGDEAYTKNAPTNAGNYTVKAYYAGDDSYNSATTTADFSIIPAQASLSYSAATIEKQVGDEPFVNMLTNNVNMKVAYSSTNPNVATVDDTGEVTLIATGTTTIKATDADTNYDAAAASYVLTVNKKEIEEPEPPVIPDYPDYYNIYVDECEGVTVETSTNVVREGNSMTFTVDVEEGYTDENMIVKVKRSLFGYSDIIKPNEDGIYEVKNIYTEIYITVDGVEEVEEPTGIGDVESTKVYAKDGSIYVQTPQLETVTIISISGEVRKQEELIGLQRYDLPRGIYIICIGEERIKVRN